MERGPGFVTASVVDPFGNVLGVMENAHDQRVVAATGPLDVGAPAEPGSAHDVTHG